MGDFKKSIIKKYKQKKFSFVCNTCTAMRYTEGRSNIVTLKEFVKPSLIGEYSSRGNPMVKMWGGVFEVCKDDWVMKDDDGGDLYLWKAKIGDDDENAFENVFEEVIEEPKE